MAPQRKRPEMQLQIPQVPHFPLSSPITEEISSPAASSNEDREMERSRPFEYLTNVSDKNPFLEAESTGTGRDRLVEREIGVFDTARGAAQGGKPKGLNLITDLPIGVPEVQTGAAGPAFVDLNDLKVLSKVRERERASQKIRGILKNGMAQGFQRLPDETSEPARRRLSWLTSESTTSRKKKKKYKDELSPSDRPIMIGYTVPCEESSQPQDDGRMGLDSAGSQRTPMTPSIVVTPAKDEGFWQGLSEFHRARATSSIYSQRTSFIGSGRPGIPPVPAIPASHFEEKGNQPDVSRRESVLSTRKQRSFSTGTVFEEEDGLRQGLRARSFSTESSKKGLDRLSVTTEINRHQSQGWWTYLLSPMLGRSSTIVSRSTPTRTERPPLPTLLTNSTVSSDEWWEKEVSYFSPDTPETAAAARGEVTNWQEGDANPFADGNSMDANTTDEKHTDEMMFQGESIQGAAAEYYQACAHELFSGRPYFECVNHVCSITPKDRIPVLLASSIAEPENNEKHLLIDVDDDVTQLAPVNPFESVSHSGARSISGTTAVDDQPASPLISNTGKKYLEEDTPKESRGHSPEPGPIEREPPVYAGDRPEKQASHLFFQPTNTISPAATNINIQPPGALPSASGAPQERIIPQYIVVPPQNYGGGGHPQPQTPDATSPGLQQATARSGSIPLTEIASGPAPACHAHRSASHTLPPRIDPAPITQEQMTHPWFERERIETRRRRLEREDAIGRKAGGLWRGRGCFSNKGCFGRPGREGRLRRRWYMAITTFFVLIVVVAVVLAVMLTRKGDGTPVQSQWLNLTGYPPMPTGIATIAGSEPQTQSSGCITPSTLWSCALPPEQQSDNKPYAPNQPSFRVEIRFRNGTYANSTTVASTSSHKTRDINGSFNPSPSPPSLKDQIFLGNTTDQNAIPYAGEDTPFFITILSTASLRSSRLSRRSNSSFPDIESLIPSPDLNSDGTAAAATLYPLPESQPVRLYNRGLDTEHYGFYTYFDRSIFLETLAPLNGSTTDNSAADANGGASETDARVRCTWAQTRFLVQIWTQPTRARKTLLRSSPSASISPSTTPTMSSLSSTSLASGTSSPTASSSATNFVRPGSFPYPVTITVDRHGGVAKEKMVYCYAMEENQRVNSTEKKLQIEDRGFGGTLVNPAPGIFNLTSSSDEVAMQDGVDGGTGGCSCQWVNWVSTS
ncbi:hypothetical protein KXW42_007320 [Aspergillus fumigatus]|nr:hypothetical protein KXV79_006230 [Aspergillus fumigatus]KAH3085793.1 hypothetical protein KXW78_006941 [Aspergillus fumigatus]KAH3386733.1 hypothetical protein KXW42_007320 [Aspergillus fumigatus]KMK61549.1 hypothetical protein Y699_02390 [Aspergillus fumigatus Z5]